MTENEEDTTFLRNLFGDKPDPAYEPSKEDSPETEMRHFTRRIFNRNTD